MMLWVGTRWCVFVCEVYLLLLENFDELCSIQFDNLD